ncbi:MAG: glycosyltransferase family 4 protein [Verrucomicrobiales bacterium]|nr:glycosyltransferase family 4 protein [Verrucomicrobiales bacterium]
MRVLHLLGATEDNGGILTVLRSLQSVSAAAELRHEVLVHQEYQETRRPALEYWRSRRLRDESPNHLDHLVRALPALWELRGMVRRHPVEIIHAHTRGALPVAIGIASLWRRPVVFTNHTYPRRRGMYRWAAKQPRLRFVVLTPNMARHLGLSPEADGVHVIPACCADHFFEVPVVERRPVGPGDRIRLVGLGNIVRWKNWHLLLRALSRLPVETRRRFTFDHWGPVPRDPDCELYRHELEDLARAAAPAGIRFRGVTLQVEDSLREADWFVLPSTNEPCSVALAESLALGIPAIASASGGNVDILKPGRTGLLFTSEDPADLARCLRQLADHEIQPAGPGEVRDSVRYRSASAVSARYLELYRECLSPPPVA